MLFNIFCDASIDIAKKTAISGAIVSDEFMQGIVDQVYSVQYDATNNSAEIYAIYLGVCRAINIMKIPNYTNVSFRLFSDSKISIFGLKEWIYKWKIDLESGKLMSVADKPISNQGYFRKIINDVVDNNLRISFIHQKGHVMINSSASLHAAEKVFYESNGFYPKYKNIDIRTISYFNNMVDTTSRTYLSSIPFIPMCTIQPNETYPISYDTISKFKMLTNNILYM